jgi:hypothetical protein
MFQGLRIHIQVNIKKKNREREKDLCKTEGEKRNKYEIFFSFLWDMYDEKKDIYSVMNHMRREEGEIFIDGRQMAIRCCKKKIEKDHSRRDVTDVFMTISVFFFFLGRREDSSMD